MNIENYILDLDNTLYDYNAPHQKAMQQVLGSFSDEFGIERDMVEKSFKLARKKTHDDLLNTAASHNRLLYFQEMLELNGIKSLDYGLKYYNLYWDTFLQKMELFQAARIFLERIKKAGKGVCLLTDLTAHIQYRKIEKLGIAAYLDFIVTSEEVGVEKPSPKMFQKALLKLNCKNNEAIMIGDNWGKDILGAAAMDIKSIWINHDNELNELPKSVIEVKNFEEINRL